MSWLVTLLHVTIDHAPAVAARHKGDTRKMVRRQEADTPGTMTALSLSPELCTIVKVLPAITQDDTHVIIVSLAIKRHWNYDLIFSRYLSFGLK